MYVYICICIYVYIFICMYICMYLYIYVCPTLGHHQGRICFKSDVTFVLANYYCVRTSLLLEIMALAFKCNSVNSASS